MPEIKDKVLAGRLAVEAYRIAHAHLYDEPWHKGIPEEHTPLLEEMKKRFKEQGFNSLKEFWGTSDLLNVQELGFADKEGFYVKVREGSTSHTEIEPETGKEVEVVELSPEGKILLNTLREMWH